MGKIQKFSKIVLICFIKLYRYCISPLLGPRCRFYPSCSQYAIEAIHLHGIVYGCYLTIKRLGKCHPWHHGGIDLVPHQRKTD
ncbi:MAG: membrane protein insertion efficiency factor YidD [Legionellales bacterium]|nr:membrane protein insertion efficiency factor YidD [Legionellales bacterium]